MRKNLLADLPTRDVMRLQCRQRHSDERDLTLAGFLTFADHLFEGVEESITRLRSDGVQVKILTGDNELVTRHICSQAGIDSGRIVLGSEVELMDEVALARVWGDATAATVQAASSAPSSLIRRGPTILPRPSRQTAAATRRRLASRRTPPR